MNANQVFYDIQKNTYYRINKNTGQILRSNKDGSLIKQFKKEVTGVDYKLRKNQLDNQFSHSKSLSIKPLISSSRLNPNNSNLKIVSQTQDILLKKKLQQKYKNKQKNNNTSSFDNLKAIQNLQTKSINKKNQNSLLGLLQKYSTLQSIKVRQNNSLLKTIQGSCPANKVPSLRQTIINFKSLNNNEHLVKKESVNKKKGVGSQILNLPYDLKTKVNDEKSIFYKFHPQLIYKQNERALNEQKQRKKNFKILENLFISQNNAATKRVYQ